MSSSLIHSWLWQNGRFAPQENIPISDRGFRYGMSLFESLRLQNGRLHFPEQHWNRLQEACSACHFPSPKDLFSQIPALLLPLPGDWFVRLYVTAGDGGPNDPVTTPRVFLLAETRTRDVNAPKHLAVSPTPYLAPFGGLKTANYWANVSAFQQAIDAGRNETILFNPKGHLVSAAMANVFLKLDGHWCTPSLETGARNGVIRSWTLSQISVREELLSEEAIHRAESAFLTNSWMGICPVERMANRVLQADRSILRLQESLESQSHGP